MYSVFEKRTEIKSERKIERQMNNKLTTIDYLSFSELLFPSLSSTCSYDIPEIPQNAC